MYNYPVKASKLKFNKAKKLLLRANKLLDKAFRSHLKADEKGCHTCAHRYSWSGWNICLRTGWQCETEMMSDSWECGPGLKLWEPRRSLARRIIRFFFGARG